MSCVMSIGDAPLPIPLKVLYIWGCFHNRFREIPHFYNRRRARKLASGAFRGRAYRAHCPALFSAGIGVRAGDGDYSRSGLQKALGGPKTGLERGGWFDVATLPVRQIASVRQKNYFRFP
jgi:hypothetical protein